MKKTSNLFAKVVLNRGKKMKVRTVVKSSLYEAVVRNGFHIVSNSQGRKILNASKEAKKTNSQRSGSLAQNR